MAGIEYTGKSVPYGVIANNGGLNSTASPLNVQDNESTDCQNVDFDIFGSVLKRNGYATLNSSAFNSGAAWNSLYWFEFGSGPTQYLIGTCGNKLAKMDDLDGTWDDITGALTVTAGNNNHVSWATHLDNALGTNGVDVPFLWTGTGNGAAMTVPTGLTTAKFVAIFANYTFLAHVTVSGTVHPSRLYWSAIDSISSWGSSDFRDVSKNDGQHITGIKALGSSLVIYKTKSIWVAQFTGDSDVPFIFSKTPSHVGCDSGHSIQEVSNGHIFHSQDGFYFFDGANSTKISDRITTTLETFGKNRFPNIISAFQKEKNRYWSSFTLSGGSTHNRCITWDSVNNAFSLYKGHNANCYAVVTVSGAERIYFGDYAGYVYRADTTTNDNPLGVATAIDGYYYTKWFNFGDLVDQKGVPHVTIYFQYTNATLTFAYSYDFESEDQYSQSFSTNAGSSVYGTAVYGTDTYAGAGGGVTRRDLTGRGHVVRLKFQNNTTSETFRVDGFGMLPHLEAVV